MVKFFQSSKNPLADIERMAYEGQPAHMRMYRSGYERDFEKLPKLDPDDTELFGLNLEISQVVMDYIASKVIRDRRTYQSQPLSNGFDRTILAVERSEEGSQKEACEIVLARWGDGFSSPVHGHAPGLLYEQMIHGKMRVNTYRIVNHEDRIVRPIESKIYEDSDAIVSSYAKASAYPRSAIVHNFTSIGNSASLHFVPEHTRDGRDNQFDVEYFEQKHRFDPKQFVQLDAKQAREHLRVGDVALVRNDMASDYGDHWITITKKPVIKNHELQLHGISIHAPHVDGILKQYHPTDGPLKWFGLRLLKINDGRLKEKFLKFHDITVRGNRITLPTA